MASDVMIRRTAAGDFDAWFAMAEKVAAEGRWIGAEAPVDRDRWREGFDAALDAEDSARFVAVDRETMVGELHVSVRGGRADFGMMVADGYRGRGVGSALMDACLAWARAVGAHKVSLQLWPHNDAALALYRKFGFVVEGRLVRHYQRRSGELWDAIEMGLVLDHTSPGSPFEDASGADA